MSISVGTTTGFKETVGDSVLMEGITEIWLPRANACSQHQDQDP